MSPWWCLWAELERKIFWSLGYAPNHVRYLVFPLGKKAKERSSLGGSSHAPTSSELQVFGLYGAAISGTFVPVIDG